MEATTENSVTEFLFNEELGLVVEVPARMIAKTQAAVSYTHLTLPTKTFVDHPVPAVLKPLVLPEDRRVMQALDRVLRLLSVGSKRFLWFLWLVWLVTSKVEWWVRGLMARQQCCTCR